MKKFIAILVAFASLAIVAPAAAQYYDEGGGNRPDCNQEHAGWWWNNMECSVDPFSGVFEWHWGY